MLWSPVVTIFFNFFIFNYIFRQTGFVDFTPTVISMVLAVEFIGLIGSSIILFNISLGLQNKAKLINFSLGVLLFILSIISLFSFLVSVFFRDLGF
jgi:hypothetical protein